MTPLWAGIAMLPLTLGFLIAGPVSGILSDRYGARPFATGGHARRRGLPSALLEFLPVDFPYWVFGRPALPHRADHGRLRLTQPGRGDEQPSGPSTGGRARG